MLSQRSRAAKETTQQSCSRNPHTRRRSDDPASPSRAAHKAATPEGGTKRAAEPLHRSQPSQTNFNWNRAMREHNTGARPQYSCAHVATFAYTQNKSIALYCIALHWSALYCLPLRSFDFSCIALRCIALYCIALHCPALCYLVEFPFVSLRNATSNTNTRDGLQELGVLDDVHSDGTTGTQPLQPGVGCGVRLVGLTWLAIGD